MARKNKQKEEPVEEEEEEEIIEETELLQVDVGDIIKVKQILDECVVSTLIQSEDLSAHGDAVDLYEDVRHDNVKLMLMLMACSFAAFAQFALAKDFPQNRMLLGACVATYFCLSGILQLIITFIDKDCIMITCPLDDEKAIKLVKNKEMQNFGIRVRSDFPRFSEFYTVTLEFQGKTAPPSFVKQTWSVGKFFDVEGYFDEVGMMEEIEQLYQRFEAGKFDKSEVDGASSKKKKA